MCGILKIMECDFKSELEDELGKLLFLYGFCYFNNKEIFKTGWYHTHYEEYDYSKYEYTDFD